MGSVGAISHPTTWYVPFIFHAAEGCKAVLDIPYVIVAGTRLILEPGKQFEAGANLTFVK